MHDTEWKEFLIYITGPSYISPWFLESNPSLTPQVCKHIWLLVIWNVYTPSYLINHTFPLFLLMSRRDITQTASPYFRTVLVNACILPVVFLFITLIIPEGNDYLACKHKISFMSLAPYIASRIQYTLKILLNKVVHFERNYFNLKWVHLCKSRNSRWDSEGTLIKYTVSKIPVSSVTAVLCWSLSLQHAFVLLSNGDSILKSALEI